MLNTIAGMLSGGVAATDFESIATANGTGSSGTITFSSIPSTYTHLQIRTFAKTSQVNAYSFLYFTLNGDTTTSYSAHELVGNGSAASASAGTSLASSWMGYCGAANTTSNYGGIVTDILDYANTNKYKTIRSLGGLDSNGAGYVSLDSGLWMKTNAISSISIISGAGNFTTASSFALYGIK